MVKKIKEFICNKVSFFRFIENKRQSIKLVKDKIKEYDIYITYKNGKIIQKGLRKKQDNKCPYCGIDIDHDNKKFLFCPDYERGMSNEDNLLRIERLLIKKLNRGLDKRRKHGKENS